MIRSRPFLATMQRLAFVAVLLMVCAPPVSRWLQAAPPDPQALCTADGLRMAVAAPSMDHVHAGHALVPLAGAVHGGGPAPDGMSGHAEHGFACDYCVLAARLLPWLAVALLLLLPRPRAMAPGSRVSPIAPAAPRWPAHAPRGPPLHA